MYSKFWKASLCFSTAYALMPDTPFSTSYKTQSDPNKDELTKAQKEAILARLLLDRQRKVQAQNKNPERIPKERHHFFEKPILESFSKIALYHLLGFIGYLPYVSTAANYLILPLVPLNLAADASVAYLYANESKELKYGGNSWTSMEVGRIADYLSYAFAFASSGGAAKGVPGFVGMMASMYIYTKFNRDNFNKTGAIMSGALGGAIPTILLSQTFTFWIGKHKRIPFALGIFASYVAFSSLVYRLMEDYMASRNEDKISTIVVSSYKWNYLYLMGLWTLFGTSE